jgi:hypothetical protein
MSCPRELLDAHVLAGVFRKTSSGLRPETTFLLHPGIHDETLKGKEAPDELAAVKELPRTPSDCDPHLLEAASKSQAQPLPGSSPLSAGPLRRLGQRQ